MLSPSLFGLIIGLGIVLLVLNQIFGKKKDGTASKAVHPLSLLAGLMILAGVLVTVYFFAFFDVSVGSPMGRVNNIGLMSDRQNGIIVGLAVLIVGVLVALFRRR